MELLWASRGAHRAAVAADEASNRQSSVDTLLPAQTTTTHEQSDEQETSNDSDGRGQPAVIATSILVATRRSGSLSLIVGLELWIAVSSVDVSSCPLIVRIQGLPSSCAWEARAEWQGPRGPQGPINLPRTPSSDCQTNRLPLVGLG